MKELRFPFQTLDPEKLVSTTFQVSFEDARKPGFDVAINTSALYQSLSEFAVVVNEQRCGIMKMNDSLDQSVHKITKEMLGQQTQCEQLGQKLRAISSDMETKFDASYRKTEELAIKFQQRLKERQNQEKLEKEVGLMRQVMDRQTKDLNFLNDTVGKLNNRLTCQIDDNRLHQMEHRLSVLELNAVKLMDGLGSQGRADEISDVLERCEKMEALTKRLTSSAVSLLAQRVPDIEPVPLDTCFSAWRTYTKNDHMRPLLTHLRRSFMRTSLAHVFSAWKARPEALRCLVRRVDESERSATVTAQRMALRRLKGNVDRKNMADYMRRLIPSQEQDTSQAPEPLERTRLKSGGAGSSKRAKKDQASDQSTSWILPIQQLAKTLSEVALRMNTFEKALCESREKKASRNSPREDADENKKNIEGLVKRINQVDGRFAEFVQLTEEKLITLREVLTHSFDSIKEFTIRQGPACLSCGQVVSTIGNMTAPPPGFDSELLSSSPDLMSVAFCHNLLALLISSFGGRYTRPLGMSPNFNISDQKWKQAPLTDGTESGYKSSFPPWSNNGWSNASTKTSFRPSTAPSEISERAKSAERKIFVGQTSPIAEKEGVHMAVYVTKTMGRSEAVKPKVPHIAINKQMRSRPASAGPQRPSHFAATQASQAKKFSVFGTPRIVKTRRIPQILRNAP